MEIISRNAGTPALLISAGADICNGNRKQRKMSKGIELSSIAVLNSQYFHNHFRNRGTELSLGQQ